MMDDNAPMVMPPNAAAPPVPALVAAALADAMVRVSHLAMHLEGHLVLPKGQGVKAVDALVVLRGT
jgi:hypothetical protein